MSGDTIGLASFLKDTSPADIDKFLATFSKYERLLDKGMSVVEKLDKMGVLPAAIRAAGVKSGVPDIDKPLRNPLALSATSPAHFQFYKFVNRIPSDKVDEMFEGLKRAIEATKQPEEPPVKVEDVERKEE